MNKRDIFKKYAFTITEMLITLTIIGALSAMLVPIIRMPNEKLTKFQKANTMLTNAIHELVTSDKYFCNGDLGMKADCKTQLTHSKTTMDYFCNTLAEIISTKKVNCAYFSDKSRTGNSHLLASYESISRIATGEKLKRTVTPETIKKTKEYLDNACKKSGKTMGAEIITIDDITLYQAGEIQFGSWRTTDKDGIEHKFRFFSPPSEFPANYGDQEGFDIAYKIYCIDIDGIPDNVTKDDCVNECPFGYGIQASGKILTGAKADEWLNKEKNKKLFSNK